MLAAPRLLGAAGVAIAAVVGLSIYALLIGSAVEQIAHAGRATGPPCRASQLSTTVGLQGATGSLLGAATIANTGRICALPAGRPTVRVTSGGKTLRVREQVPPRRFPGPVARTLGPGTRAIVWIQWFNWCGRRVAPPTFHLRFGSDLLLSARESGYPRCDSPQTRSLLYASVPR